MIKTIAMTKDGVVKYIHENQEKDYAKLGWVRKDKNDAPYRNNSYGK